MPDRAETCNGDCFTLRETARELGILAWPLCDDCEQSIIDAAAELGIDLRPSGERDA